MTEFTMILKMVESLGFPALLFAVWYFDNKSQASQFKKIISLQSEREKQNFELLDGLIKANNENTGLLKEINSKISDKIYCPYTRRFVEKSSKVG